MLDDGFKGNKDNVSRLPSIESSGAVRLSFVDDEEDDDQPESSFRSTVTYPRLIPRPAQYAVRLFPNFQHRHVTEEESRTYPEKEADILFSPMMRKRSWRSSWSFTTVTPKVFTFCHFTPLTRGPRGITYCLYDHKREREGPYLLRYRNHNMTDEKTVKAEVGHFKKMGSSPYFFPFVDHQTVKDQGFEEYLTWLYYGPNCYTLKEYAMKNPMGETEVWKVIQGIAGALKELHRNGFCHMDLKLDTICITEQGQIKLADIGFSAVPNPIDRLWMVTDYTAPEAYSACVANHLEMKKLSVSSPYSWRNYHTRKQAKCFEQAGQELDYYSLGCIAYELFVGETPSQFFRRHYGSRPSTKNIINQMEHEAGLQGEIMIPLNFDEHKQHFLRQLLQSHSRNPLHAEALETTMKLTQNIPEDATPTQTQ